MFNFDIMNRFAVLSGVRLHELSLSLLWNSLGTQSGEHNHNPNLNPNLNPNPKPNLNPKSGRATAMCVGYVTSMT